MLFKNDTHGLSTTKKYLDTAGLGHLSSLIVSFVRNYASPKSHNHDGVYAKSAHTHTTAQVTGLDSALSGKAPTSHTHTIAQVTNLQSQLDSKVPVGRLINKKPLSADMTLTPADIGADAAGAATNALNSAKQYTDTVAAGKAAKSHMHDATNITTGTLSQDRLPLVPVAKGGTGKTNGKDAANYFINSLEEGTAIPTDSDKILTQYVGGGTANTTYVRRPLSTLWSYIKPKCDAVYQAKGSYAASSHTHAISNITNLQAQLDGKQAKGSYAAASHTHNASEITNLFDYIKNKTIGSDIPNLPSDADLNNYKTPGVYCHPSTGGSIKNSPYGSGQAFRLVVFCSLGSNSPYIGQRVNGYSENHISYTRYYDPWAGSGGTWGNWHTNSTSSGSGSGSSGGVNLGKLMYPVGAVYISWSSTSPASLFGGSWVAITGRFPYFNAGTSQGGSNSHTLSINEMPRHIHQLHVATWSSGFGGSGLATANENSDWWTSWADGTGMQGTGNSKPHNNMPSYQTLYAWRRTA